MRRSLSAALLAGVGLILLVDFALVNPIIGTVADALLELVVLLAAAAALAGAVALVMRHWSDIAAGRRDPAGSVVLMGGFGAMLIAGFYPGSLGAEDPAVRWLVAAFMGPLIASVFAMLFVFLLMAARRGLALHTRQVAVMLAAALIVIVLLLPIGGASGHWLAAAAGWAMSVTISGVFRGLLIGVAIVTAVHASRVLLAVDGGDD